MNRPTGGAPLVGTRCPVATRRGAMPRRPRVLLRDYHLQLSEFSTDGRFVATRVGRTVYALTVAKESPTVQRTHRSRHGTPSVSSRRGDRNRLRRLTCS